MLEATKTFIFIMTLILDFERKFFDINQEKGTKMERYFILDASNQKDLQNIVYYFPLKRSDPNFLKVVKLMNM